MVLNISNNNFSSNQLKDLNTLGLDLVKDYNIVVDNYSKAYGSNHYFWSSELPSRNSNDNDIFKNIVFSTYIINLVTTNKKITQIIVSDYSIYKVLKKNLKNYNIKIVLRTSYNKMLIIYLYPILKFFFNSYLLLKTFLISRFTYLICDKKKIKDNLILVDTFIVKSSLNKNGFNDLYYKNFLGYFKNLNYYYLPSFLGINNHYKTFMTLRKSEHKFFFKEDYLNFFDYIKAIFLPLKLLNFKPTNIFIRDIDFTTLFEDNWYKNLSSLSSMNSILNYFFIKQLKKNKIKINCFLNWFENQSCDKCYNLALSKYYPKVFRSGFMVFFDSKFYTSLYPTQNEKNNNLLPNKIFTSSSLFANSIKEYCKDLKTGTITSFRNQFIWDFEKNNVKNKNFTILVTLSGVDVYRNDVLNLISQINSFNFLVKLHPADNINSVKKSFKKKWPNNFNLVSSSLESIINKVDLLISSNSTTILDSLSLGIPVIIIGGKFSLIQNPIPIQVPKSLFKVVYSKNELEKSLVYFKYKFRPKSKKIINDFKKTKNELNTKPSLEDFNNLININKKC